VRLVTLGDSWTEGSELWDPALGPQKYPYPIIYKEHTDYRNTHAWPGQLGSLLEIDELINLGWPGGSNDTSIRRLTRWLTTEGYLNGRPGNDLTVIIAWTKPDSIEFVPTDIDAAKEICQWPYTADQHWVTLQPPSFEKDRWSKFCGIKEIDEFSRTYYLKWCNPKEYFYRYINQNWMFQNLMNQIGANWLSFQNVYDNLGVEFDQWEDHNSDLTTADIDPADRALWNMIDPLRFFNKDQKVCTFHNFLMKSGIPRDKVMLKTHPTEFGHRLWSEELYKHIKNYELFK